MRHPDFFITSNRTSVLVDLRRTVAAAWLILLVAVVSAQTNSQQAGDWSDDCTWDPVPCAGGSDVPGSNDDVNVNHDITLDQNLTIGKGNWVFNNPVDDPNGGGNFTLTTSGTGSDDAELDINANTRFRGAMSIGSNTLLTVRSGDTLTVGGGSSFANGSTVVIEAGGVIKVKGNFQNNNNSNGITINGTMIVTGLFTNGNGGVVAGTGSLEADEISNNSNGSSCLFGNCGDVADCPSGGCSVSTGGVLPIDLLYFTGQFSGNEVQMRWATGEEVNNDFFEVQFSNNLKDWEAKGMILGAGNSSELLEYEFNLASEALNGEKYVRLVQFDYNGTAHVFSPISIDINTGRDVRLYPNPFDEYLMVDLVGFEGSDVIITVYDALGVEVFTHDISTRVDFGTYRLDMSEIEKGVYYWSLKSLNNGHYSEKRPLRKGD